MKLRNKKTGGLANLIVDKDTLRVETDAGWADYNSLAELNANWEDYKPPEPLIKDEKIRKAVRAWAEANDYGEEDNYEFCDFSTGWKGWSLEHKGNNDDNEIHFNGGIDFDRATHGSLYTIAELCDEEEE